MTKGNNPVQFQNFLRDFNTYYKESYMDRASLEGQKHYLLKCLDAELCERMLAITYAKTPIFDVPGNSTRSCFTHAHNEAFHRRFPMINRRKDFFFQSQGTQKFTAYIDKLRNMAVEPTWQKPPRRTSSW